MDGGLRRSFTSQKRSVLRSSQRFFTLARRWQRGQGELGLRRTNGGATTTSGTSFTKRHKFGLPNIWSDAVASEFQAAVARGVKVDDVFEPRLGVEYFFADLKYPVSLRGGIWKERRPTLRAKLNPGLDANDASGEVRTNTILFSIGKDEVHCSPGFGIAFPSFQLDFATDQADSQDIYSALAAWRF